MYQLVYHPRIDKFFKKIPLKEAQKVLIRLRELADDPFSDTLDIKKLTTTSPAYRLRVGKIRIVYEVEAVKKYIFIQDIGFRGSIY